MLSLSLKWLDLFNSNIWDSLNQGNWMFWQGEPSVFNVQKVQALEVNIITDSLHG